ncbi:MAG: hypothetical protein AB7F94_12690, partial [Nitrospira sp.]
MNPIKTALELYKESDGAASDRISSKWTEDQSIPPSIIYTRTRSLAIPLPVLHEHRVMAANKY